MSYTYVSQIVVIPCLLKGPVLMQNVDPSKDLLDANGHVHANGLMADVKGFLQRAKKAIWGDLPSREYMKIAFLAFMFTMIVGSYWLLRTQKDALFMKVRLVHEVLHVCMAN